MGACSSRQLLEECRRTLPQQNNERVDEERFRNDKIQTPGEQTAS
jgi:hypothetical protein